MRPQDCPQRVYRPVWGVRLAVGFSATARAWLAAAVWVWAALGGTAIAAALANDPPRSVALDLAMPPAQWLPQVLPEGARLLHGPVALAFGAHASGQLLAWRTAEGGYAVVYLTPDADEPGRQRWLWLREPRTTDDAFDVQVHAALALGPPLSRDIVLLETYSRSAPAGGARDEAGTVYRRVGDGVEAVALLSERLRGVTQAAEARARLAPVYAGLLPAVPGRLAALYASLPWPWVEATALERLQSLRSGHTAYRVYDPANGFLEVRGEGGLPGYQAALFKHADGGWMLALQKRWPESQRTWFLRPAAAAPGGWQDLSAELMPGFRAEARYQLPQRGRTVRGEGAVAWQWTGRRFETVAAAR